jgi:hypothetical protein
VRGRGAIYGWIVGRSLESLAGHCSWLRANCPEEMHLLQRLEHMLSETLDRANDMRQHNGGRMFFCMRADGAPLVFDSAQGAPVPTEASAHNGERRRRRSSAPF